MASMRDDGPELGELGRLVQAWMDSIPYPPSRSRLARTIGVSKSTMGNWMRGGGWPETEPLRRLATEIGVPWETVVNAVLIDRGWRRPQGPDSERRRRRGA